MFEIILFVTVFVVTWAGLVMLGDHNEVKLRHLIGTGGQFYGVCHNGEAVLAPRPLDMSERAWLFVVNHELGHVANHDIPVLLGWNGLNTALFIDACVYGSTVSWVLFALTTVLYPALRVIQEVRADAYAVRAVGLPGDEEFRSSIQMLTDGKAYRKSCSRWSWLYGYPPLAIRIALHHRAANRA